MRKTHNKIAKKMVPENMLEKLVSK